MEATPQPALDLARFPHRREFHFGGDPATVTPAVEQMIAFVSANCPADDVAPELSLALQEALANAVVHGCNSDPNKTVDCLVACGPTEVLMILRDPGPGFDPRAIRNPLSSDGLAADHGRGVHMIRELMDEVRYERNGTELQMLKRL